MSSLGIACSIDLFGERVSDPAEADRVVEEYLVLGRTLARAPAGTCLSLDLSHIGIDEPGGAAVRRLQRIAEALPAGASIQVGAEEARRADRILEAVLAIAAHGLPVSATLQANLRRSPADAGRLAQAGVAVRLVKGAYVETRADAYPWGEATDTAFIQLAHQLHGEGVTLTLGTHDPVLRAALLRALPGTGVEMLLGVRSDEPRVLAASGVPVRIYVPYGNHWFRYTMRRLAEARGA